MTRARDAGARFALSPGMSDELVQAALDCALPFIPGVMTPGEVMRAREHGFGLLKLFPAEQAGGVGMLKALAGPLPEMRFCPTGGVSPSNLTQYLKQPNVAMVGGSWLTPASALEQGRWQDITDLAAQATALAAAQ
jgi:2-dehydro-3-deoxyphosphogluconate aldolase/(4S)-4-hydroxy-2-oxoglutarate aldolase